MPLQSIFKHLPICMLLLISACSENPPKTTQPAAVNKNKNSIDFVKQKTTAPTIIFQSGLGDGKEAWKDVLPTLASRYSVLAFDRPGRGQQPATDASRDPCSIAREQHELLISVGAKPPYVLVGHSLGGLYQYAFAQLYSAEVAGMVLVDPTPPHHWEAIQREAPAAANMLKVVRFVGFSKTDKREFDQQSECVDTLIRNPPINKPVQILVAGRFTGAGESGDFEKMMKKSRLQWLALTGAHQLQTVWDSGHYIQKESPEVVIEAIDQVMSEIHGHSS